MSDGPGDGTWHQVQHWLDRFNAGDPEAHGWLLDYALRNWRKNVSTTLHGEFDRVASREQTDDVLSLVCGRVLADWRRGYAPTTPGEFFAQLNQNLRNVLLNLVDTHYGQDGDRPAPLPLEGGTDSDAGPGHDRGTDTDDPARIAEFAEFHRQVAALPEGVRDVFELLFFDHVTQAEAARALGVTVRTVRQRYDEARLRLRPYLPATLRPGESA
jgi:RNA polymerase sigma-70 factor (ECF subfamily)